jgi:hypothetical protein
MMPVKDAHTRIKSLALASGHGRYMLHNRHTRTDTHVRWGMAVTCDRYKFLSVSLLKRFRNGHFASETATWIQMHFKNLLELLESPIQEKSNFFFEVGAFRQVLAFGTMSAIF